MATSKIITILVVALIAAFFVLMSIPASYIPFSKGPNYARYENFAEGAFGAGGAFGTEGAESTVGTEGSVGTESTFGTEIAKTTGEDKNSKNSNKMSTGENFEPIMEVPKTIQYGELRDSEIINTFSQTASTGTHSVSSGIAKCEGGSVCLSPELIQLLKTRGGNASGN